MSINTDRLQLLVTAKMSVLNAIRRFDQGAAGVHFRKAHYWIKEAIERVRNDTGGTVQMENAMAHLRRARAELVLQGVLD